MKINQFIVVCKNNGLRFGIISLMCIAGFLLASNGFAKDKKMTPVLVEISTVKRATIPKQIYALGSLTAQESAVISSEVNGRVAKIFFQDGQEVAKGMPIIQLDNEEDKANYASAVAALNLSETQYKRGKLLSQQGAISQGDLDQLKANVEKQQAVVKNSLVALNQKELVAPFSGMLAAFQIKEGDFINQGQPLVSLVNGKQLKAEYSVPEDMLAELALGQQVEITSSAYPDKVFYGIVTYIAPMVDPVSRSIALQATIPNKDGALSPGMFVHVTQNIAIDSNALVIPEQAITASVNGYYVYEIAGTKAALTFIKIGVHQNGYVQVLSGLALGDTVVIAGQQKLQDGSTVEILNDKSKAN